MKFSTLLVLCIMGSTFAPLVDLVYGNPSVSFDDFFRPAFIAGYVLLGILLVVFLISLVGSSKTAKNKPSAAAPAPKPIVEAKAVMPKPTVTPTPATKAISSLPPNANAQQVKNFAEANGLVGKTIPYVWNYYSNPEDRTGNPTESFPGNVVYAATSKERYVFVVDRARHSYSARNLNTRFSEFCKARRAPAIQLATA
jgi:hypothetical protein